MFPGQVLFGLAKARYCIYSTYFRCSLGNTWFVFLGNVFFFPHMFVSSFPYGIYFSHMFAILVSVFPGSLQERRKEEDSEILQKKRGKRCREQSWRGLSPIKATPTDQRMLLFPDITTASLLVLCRGDWGISTNPSR